MATLSNFGISAPGGSEGLGILMPKLKYRFRVTFQGGGMSSQGSGRLTELTQQVVSAGRPNIQHNRTALHSYNNIMYIPQKPEWQNLEIVLRDDLSNKATELVANQLKAQMNHFDQTSGQAGSQYKFVTHIQTLNGSHASTPNEEWVLEGCFLETVAYDSFDYSSSDPVQITLTISYDNATQLGGLGTYFTAGQDGLAAGETPLPGR